MFTKRKGIVIGETYLFDVLNETNMANSTSLVTVVKKEKADTYVVVSVNCGDIFRTKGDSSDSTYERCHLWWDKVSAKASKS